jgi:penicillin-binding protein 2
VHPDTRFPDPGYFYLGSQKFDDWKKGGHGPLNMRGAVVNSCNVWFYNAALRVGIDEIVRVSRLFGLGEPPGLGLGDEARGNLPNPQPRRRGQPGWSPGNTVVAGIGQGAVVTSPMQLLALVSAIANGGKMYRPYVVKRVVSLSGEVLDEYEPELIREVAVRPETLAFVREAMIGVVNEGTGGRAKIPGVTIGGKTGTAQVVKKGEGKGVAALKDHGWFASFAGRSPEAPEIALVILVETGGFGGYVAAYEAYFAPRPSAAAEVPADAVPEEGD